MATVEAPIRPRTRAQQSPFRNEPMLDFTKWDVARQMRAALDKVHGQLGREYDLIIGGHRVKTAEKIRSVNPARPSEIVGIHQKAGKEHVEPAMQAALKAYEHWSRTPLEERVSLLFRTADILRERKFELMAWLVYEVSKNWERPMLISPRPSTSANFTRVRHNGLAMPKLRCNYLAKSIISSMYRWEWER